MRCPKMAQNEVTRENDDPYPKHHGRGRGGGKKDCLTQGGNCQWKLKGLTDEGLGGRGNGSTASGNTATKTGGGRGGGRQCPFTGQRKTKKGPVGNHERDKQPTREWSNLGGTVGESRHNGRSRPGNQKGKAKRNLPGTVGELNRTPHVNVGSLKNQGILVGKKRKGRKFQNWVKIPR